jgi:hypothetical protein
MVSQPPFFGEVKASESGVEVTRCRKISGIERKLADAMTCPLQRCAAAA